MSTNALAFILYLVKVLCAPFAPSPRPFTDVRLRVQENATVREGCELECGTARRAALRAHPRIRHAIRGHLGAFSSELMSPYSVSSGNRTMLTIGIWAPADPHGRLSRGDLGRLRGRHGRLLVLRKWRTHLPAGTSPSARA